MDNWEVLCHNSQSVQESLDAVLSFARLLDLQVDQQKTCVWAIRSEDRQRLRESGLKLVQDIRDLGAHLVYSKQVRNATLKQRFQSLEPFWSKLHRAQGGFKAKVRVVRTAGWPKALHGVSSTLIGKKHFHSLRVGMVKGLGLNKPGINPFLVGLAVGSVDPHFLAIIDTIRDWRRIGDFSHQEALLPSLHAMNQQVGPCSLTQVFQQRLHVLGWCLQANGAVLIPGRQQPIDINHCHWGELQVELDQAWLKVVCAQVAHRPCFHWLHRVNISHTRKAVDREESVAQGILRRLLTGATFTNEHACFWSHDGNDKCVACGGSDSLHHRFWSCPGTQSHRDKLEPCLLESLEELPAVIVDHGWTLTSHLAGWWKQYLCTLSDRVPVPDVKPCGPLTDVFTDGSCFWPTQEEFRIAAWAVCLAGPIHMNASANETVVLGAGHLAGLIQTAFRAELMALKVTLQWALEWTGVVRIWLDCQGVIDRYNLHAVGGKPVSAVSSNGDLWQEVVDLANSVGLHRIQLVKIDAHVAITDFTPEALRWARINNGCVDSAAKECNKSRGSGFWTLWHEHADTTVKLQQIADRVRAHQIAVLQTWNDMQEVSQPAMDREPKRGKSHRKIWNDVHCLEEVPVKAIRLLGQQFSSKLATWWNEIVDWTNQTLCWISFAQLYIHFQLTVRHPGLLRNKRKWVDPEVHQLCIPEDYSFRERSKWFRLSLQQLWKVAKFHIGTASTRPQSRMLLCHVGCVSMPIVDGAIDLIDCWLDGKVNPIMGCGVGLDRIPAAW